MFFFFYKTPYQNVRCQLLLLLFLGRSKNVGVSRFAPIGMSGLWREIWLRMRAGLQVDKGVTLSQDKHRISVGFLDKRSVFSHLMFMCRALCWTLSIQ